MGVTCGDGGTCGVDGCPSPVASAPPCDNGELRPPAPGEPPDTGEAKAWLGPPPAIPEGSGAPTPPSPGMPDASGELPAIPPGALMAPGVAGVGLGTPSTPVALRPLALSPKSREPDTPAASARPLALAPKTREPDASPTPLRPLALTPKSRGPVIRPSLLYVFPLAELLEFAGAWPPIFAPASVVDRPSAPPPVAPSPLVPAVVLLGEGSTLAALPIPPAPPSPPSTLVSPVAVGTLDSAAELPPAPPSPPGCWACSTSSGVNGALRGGGTSRFAPWLFIQLSTSARGLSNSFCAASMIELFANIAAPPACRLHSCTTSLTAATFAGIT